MQNQLPFALDIKRIELGARTTLASELDLISEAEPVLELAERAGFDRDSARQHDHKVRERLSFVEVVRGEQNHFVALALG